MNQDAIIRDLRAAIAAVGHTSDLAKGKRLPGHVEHRDRRGRRYWGWPDGHPRSLVHADDHAEMEDELRGLHARAVERGDRDGARMYGRAVIAHAEAGEAWHRANRTGKGRHWRKAKEMSARAWHPDHEESNGHALRARSNRASRARSWGPVRAAREALHEHGLEKGRRIPLIRLGFATLRKSGGGPYVGPRGGLWANPEHTVPWHDTPLHRAYKEAIAKSEHHAELSEKAETDGLPHAAKQHADHSDAHFEEAQRHLAAIRGDDVEDDDDPGVDLDPWDEDDEAPLAKAVFVFDPRRMR